MLRVRKRVALMVVTVSVIFGICWGMEQVVYTLMLTASYKINPVLIAIVDTVVMFSSAVNPFVYALLSQQFKTKMRKMVCCTGFIAQRVLPTQEPRDIELANNQQPQAHPAENFARIEGIISSC